MYIACNVGGKTTNNEKQIRGQLRGFLKPRQRAEESESNLGAGGLQTSRSTGWGTPTERQSWCGKLGRNGEGVGSKGRMSD